MQTIKTATSILVLSAFLAAAPAYAADPTDKGSTLGIDVLSAPAMVNFSGFYIGGAVGFGNANHDLSVHDYFKDYCSDDTLNEGFNPFDNSDRSKTLANRKKAAVGDTNNTLNPLYNPLDDTFAGGDGVSGTNEGFPQGQFVDTPINTTAWSACEDVVRGNNSNRGAGDIGSRTASPFLGDNYSNHPGSASTGGGLANVPGDSQEIARLDGMNTDGLVGDVRIGYDQAFGRFLVGVFGSYGFSAMDGSGSINLGGPIGASASLEKGDEWSLGVRAGMIVAPRTLAYILAAYTQTDYDFKVDVAGKNLISTNTTFDGLTVGGGVEFALAQNVFFGIEGTHTFYGEETLFDSYDPKTNQGIKINDDLGETRVVGTLKIKLNRDTFRRD